MKKELNIIILGASLWCAGFIIAPFLSGTVSEMIYRLYSVVCHQFESRSFHLHGAPLAVCIRCTSIYLSFVLTLLILRLWSPLREMKVNTAVILFVTALPMSIDGLLTLIGEYQATDASRILTGSLFGAGMAALLHQPLSDTVRSLFFKENPIS